HTLEIADTGIRNILKHFDVLDGNPVSLEDRGLAPMRAMHMPVDECFVIADGDGLYETLVDLDEEVETGRAIGQMHDSDHPERDPVVYRAGTSGTLIGRTHKVLMLAGDFVALIAHEDDRHGRSAGD
ncbi:MAG: succinylglutamate desuccinylase/aspartoacylase family protein, partial [Rhodospirillales bacterium]|nr:succinylglutamate desuccinylase/aspartoacylase family protein [Rhodospirillales bacterium]